MYYLEHIKKIKEEYEAFEKDIIHRCKFSANAEYGSPYECYTNKIIQNSDNCIIQISEELIWCEFIYNERDRNEATYSLEIEEVQMSMEDFEKHINSKFASQIRGRELEKRRQLSAVENAERAELERLTRKYK
jgi:hypothetical protein